MNHCKFLVILPENIKNNDEITVTIRQIMLLVSPEIENEAFWLADSTNKTSIKQDTEHMRGL